MELKALVEDFVSQRVPMLIKCNVVRSYTNLTIWGFFLCLESGDNCCIYALSKLYIPSEG